MVERAVIESVECYLKALQDKGFPVTFAVLFGSHVSGRPTEWSDIDLLIVSPRFDAPRTREDINLLWRVAARTDSRIEPVPCGEMQWQDDQVRTIIEVARREGLKVELQPA